eukprot:8252057-Alexandrium_andersonii.AAC.1
MCIRDSLRKRAIARAVGPTAPFPAFLAHDYFQVVRPGRPAARAGQSRAESASALKPIANALGLSLIHI